jgi:biopolymer transport protein TolR
LLVIFMISAPLMVQGIQVNLPEASSEALPVQNAEPLIVSIDQDGTLFLETGSTKNKPLTLDELNVSVSKIIEASPGLQVVIRGDGQVKYEKVMTVMAELQMAGAIDIGLISKPISSN